MYACLISAKRTQKKTTRMAAIDMRPKIRTGVGNLFVPRPCQVQQGSSGPTPFQLTKNKGLRLKIWHFTADSMAMTKKKKKVFA